MKVVRSYIAKAGLEFTARPLFAYLQDAGIDPRRRLTFVPFLSHFVMSFADLYRFFLVADAPRDRLAEIANLHLGEDAGHWKWFLADLDAMGLNPTLPFTDALRFVWSDATVQTRRLTYQICKLSSGMDSFQRLAMINCIEVSGGVALRAVAAAGRAVNPESSKKLVYFGSHHVDTESEHTLENADVIGSLDAIVLDDQKRKSLCAEVDAVFASLTSFVDEIFDIAKSGLTLEEAVAPQKAGSLDRRRVD